MTSIAATLLAATFGLLAFGTLTGAEFLLDASCTSRCGVNILNTLIGDLGRAPVGLGLLGFAAISPVLVGNT